MAVNKAGSVSQATERTYMTGIHHFLHESARNPCPDSSARNRAENLSGIVWKIQVRLHRYLSPPAPKN